MLWEVDHEGEVEHRHHGGMAAVVRGAALELCVRGVYKARCEEALVSHLVLFDIPVPRPILHAGVCFTLATEVMAPIVSTIGVKNPAAAVGSGSTTKSLAGEGLFIGRDRGRGQHHAAALREGPDVERRDRQPEPRLRKARVGSTGGSSAPGHHR